MVKRKIIFLTILILAFCLRFIGLEKFSPPLNRDEAALGYNSYSLIQTGKDEHGKSWPMAFESIGDYKMPGYIYLSIIPIRILGLTVFSTRFFSAFSGFLAIIVIYFLSKEISLILKLDKRRQQLLSIISSLLLAINPWHIHYSRIAFEANVNLTVFLFALYFFFKAQKFPKYYILSALLFVAMQFIYSSTFVFLPLFLFSLPFIIDTKNFKNKNNLKYFLVASIFFVLGSAIAAREVFSVSSAKASITVFSDPTIADQFSKIRTYWNQKNIIVAKLFFNKNFYILKIIFANYLKSFSPSFLLFNRINHPWHSIYGQGFFYLIDYPVFFMGIAYLIKIYKQNKKIVLFLFTWLLLSPIASAITVDAPHATRSIYLIPIIIIIISLALVNILKLNFLTNKKYSLIFLFYLLFFSNFLYQYLYVYPQNYPSTFLSESKQVFNFLEINYPNEPIYISNLSDSIYLNYIFYQKINPNIVQSKSIWTQKDIAGLFNISKLNNYNFVNNFENIDSGILVQQINNKDKKFSQFDHLIFNRFNQPKWGIKMLK